MQIFKAIAEIVVRCENI